MNELLPANPYPGLWSSVWKLLRLRLLIFFSGFRRAKTRRKVGAILVGILILGLLGFIFFVSWMLLGFLRSPELTEIVGDVSPFLEAVPVLIVSGAFLGILATSFGVLLQALYLAGDMDFLLTTPIPIRAVFLSKLLQAILPNFGLTCLFALPILFGLGAAGGYNFLYYPLVVVVLAALALAAAGISSLLVMGVVRIFPARRVAEVLGFIGAVSSFFCSQTGNVANWEDISPEQVGGLASLVTRFNNPWSPFVWAGRGLVDWGSGQWMSGAGFLFLALGSAALIFFVALTTAERLYYSGWANIQISHQKKKPTRQVRRNMLTDLASLIGSWLPPAVRALILKDYLVLRRDLRNMSQLVTPLIFGLIYAVVLAREGSPAVPADTDVPVFMVAFTRNIPMYANVGLSLFVGWMLLGRLASMGISAEGKSYWVLKSAPLNPNQLLLAKFLVAYLPALALGWLFLFGISVVQKASPGVVLFTMMVVGLSVAGNAGLNLGFGVIGANLDWDDPRQMNRGSSGCLAALAVIVYLPLVLLFFFLPPLAFPLLGLPEWTGTLVGLLVGGVASLGCAIIPLVLVRKRIASLGEH